MDQVKFPSPPRQLQATPPAEPVNPRPKRFQQTFLVHGLLLGLTFLTTLIAGFFLQISFISSSQDEMLFRLQRVMTQPLDLLQGLPFSFTMLTILLAHEMGHYLTCRHYRIRASLPYVIPAPPPFVPFGTFGAVIKIQSMFRNRRQLFDVGIAGPLAGFLFIVPAMIIGIQRSTEFVVSGSIQSAIQFGEPLLFQWGVQLFFDAPPGTPINLHPIGWAAWFGMLATSLNLLPVGQLDGGHIVYALFGGHLHRMVSYATFAGLILLSLYSWPMFGYLLFAFILIFIGFRHPRPYLDNPVGDPVRVFTAVIGFVIFILTFIPIPVQIVEGF